MQSTKKPAHAHKFVKGALPGGTYCHFFDANPMRTINRDVNVKKLSKFHKASEPRCGLRGVPAGVEGRERLLPSIALSSGILCNHE